MASILSARVDGLAGRRKPLTINFQQDLNVIWGFNGSGKTSLLKILHSALVNDATSLLRVPFDSAEVVLSLGRGRTGSRQVKRRISRRELEAARPTVDVDDDSARQFYFTFQGAVDDSKSAIRWNSSSEIDGASNIRHGYLPISRVSEGRGRGGRRRTASELIDEAAFDRLFAEQIQEVWRSYSHRALLRIREAQDQGLAGILRSVLLGGNALPPRGQKRETAEEAYKLVQEFFASQRLGRILQLSLDDFRDSYTQNQVVTDVVAEIREVQRGIKSAQEPQRRIESLLSDLYSGGKVVALSGEVGITLDGEPIPLESLSSGEKQLLQLLLETLAADANPVLIDEPELSLHVDWQSRLVECLQTVNENAQLIMATHSPEVMARLADRYVYEI